jgi:hypothetical protein
MGSKWILGEFDGRWSWIQLAQDRDVWRAVVNTVMYLVLAPRSYLLCNYSVRSRCLFYFFQFSFPMYIKCGGRSDAGGSFSQR